MAFGRRVAGVAAMPPRSHFIRGMVHNAAIALGLIGGGLAIGMSGYHSLGEMSWLEAFYYSSMILAGEGPRAAPLSAPVQPGDLLARRRHRRLVKLRVA
jgi:hypothetical protein